MEAVTPDVVFQYVSNPETLAMLSPTILCLTTKDMHPPGRKSRSTVDMSISFTLKSPLCCLPCTTTRTMDATMRAERQNLAVYIRTRPDTSREIAHSIIIEQYGTGSRVVNKVVLPPHPLFKLLWSSRIKAEQANFLKGLHDCVKDAVFGDGLANRKLGITRSPSAALLTEV